MLAEHPDIDALFLAAAGVNGACRAVEAMKPARPLKIVSYDTTPTTCELVRRGVIVATIGQQPFIQGAKPLDILLDYVGMNIHPEKELQYTQIEIKILENL
jgi:LacI family transcriptional regulator